MKDKAANAFIAWNLPSSANFAVDHFVPKADGGKDTWSNLVGACLECNNKKGRKAVDDFKQEIPVIMAKRDLRYLEKSFAKLDDVLARTVSHIEYAYSLMFYGDMFSLTEHIIKSAKEWQEKQI